MLKTKMSTKVPNILYFTAATINRHEFLFDVPYLWFQTKTKTRCKTMHKVYYIWNTFRENWFVIIAAEITQQSYWCIDELWSGKAKLKWSPRFIWSTNLVRLLSRHQDLMCSILDVRWGEIRRSSRCLTTNCV